MKVYDLLVPSERRSWSDSVLEVFAYGTIQFALTYWALDWLVNIRFDGSWPSRLGVTIYLLVIPALLGISAYRILAWEWLRRWVHHPARSGWDFFFRRAQPCWVVCHLKTGGILGGKFDSGSLASSFPNQPDIYLEEIWQISPEGKFLEPVEGTAGAYVRVDDCRLVEFFRMR